MLKKMKKNMKKFSVLGFIVFSFMGPSITFARNVVSRAIE